MTEREALLQSQVEKSNKQLEEALLEIKLLREKVDALVRMIYGTKSEKLDPHQLTMLLEGLDSQEGSSAKKPDALTADDVQAAGAPQKKARNKSSAPRLPENLPVEETIVDPLEVQAEPEAWRCMGEEISEQLDYQPGHFLKRRLVRRKFVRRDHPYAPPVIAPLPPQLQERCLAAPGLIAQVVTAKYVDHLPLYRQEQIYRQRHGVEVPRQTLCRWVALAADWFEPIYNEMIRRQMANPRAYVQIDETPIRYLQPGLGKCAQGYFWVSHVPGGDAIYHWHPGRGADCLHQIVPEDFQGTLQCDGYTSYPAFRKQRAGPLKLAACMAHVRRKFIEAKERDPFRAGWIINQIRNLYHIESRLRKRKAGPALREAVRAAESAPILRRIKKALMLFKPQFLPQSSMGKAISYALGQWQGLEIYLQIGAVEIDNNLVENAIRTTALGKKNWLFLGSEGSGRISAILYTIVESAKRHGLEPRAYLLHLLETLPRSTNHQIPSLTPDAVASSQQRSRKQPLAKTATAA